MRLDSDGVSVRFDTSAGGRVASVRIRGWEVLATEGADLHHWGNFVIAPWVGRLRHGLLHHGGRTHRFPRNAGPHAVHGLVTREVWREVGPGRLEVDLPDPWPWPGRVVHEVEAGPDHLSFRLTLHAKEPMPAAMGWHPWFPTAIAGPGGVQAGPVQIQAEPALMWAHDEEGIPSGDLVPPGPRPWDYCFRDLPAPPKVRWPGALELEIRSDCPEWVIYDREPQAVCVEPWTAPPNSLNTPSPRIVRPGEPLTAGMTWTWRMLD